MKAFVDVVVEARGLQNPDIILGADGDTEKCIITSITRPDKTLNLTSRKYLEQFTKIKLTFVQAKFVLATFVHIRNISAVTDPMLTKLQRQVP